MKAARCFDDLGRRKRFRIDSAWYIEGVASRHRPGSSPVDVSAAALGEERHEVARLHGNLQRAYQIRARTGQVRPVTDNAFRSQLRFSEGKEASLA